MKMLRIAWFSPHPIHYNNFLFDQLKKSLSIHLELFFFNKVLSKYPWKEQNNSDFPSYVLRKWGGVDWKLLFRLGQSKKDSFDVMIIAGWSEPTMIILLTYLRIVKSRYVLYTDTPNEIRKRNLKQYLRRIWLSWILAGSEANLVTGQKGCKTLQQWGAKIDTIYNFPFATNLDFFVPHKEFPSSFGNRMRIFSSGRLDIQHKGYDVALRALALLKQRTPMVQFVYAIAGTGPDEREIRQLVIDLSLVEEVQFLGWLETNELLKQYQMADVLLHTANNDPFPNAVLEAMACGLVVVGSDSSGSVVERIEHRFNGFIHQTKDIESVFDNLSYLADRSNDEIKQIKQQAYNTSRAWPVVYNVEVMRKILFDKSCSV